MVITGGNGGIGKATAEDLYKRGAKVIMLCRNVEKAREAVEDIITGGRKDKVVEEGGGRDKGTLEVMKLDLSSLASVKECAKELAEAEDRINILINNAGKCEMLPNAIFCEC